MESFSLGTHLITKTHIKTVLTTELLQAVGRLLDPLSSLNQQCLHVFRQQRMQLQFQ